jgi:hypothetical protein
MPADLEPLLNALRQLATRWPCAQRYIDIIQVILDSKNYPGGPTGLDIFNDTGRTVYALQNRLGNLTGNRMTEMYPYSLDFLDVSVNDFNHPWNSFDSEISSEWL